ncbi:hypothetical protein BDW22DRAFT_1399493 [Trametopsis cervina]|nr:hypothetical protein BDW22DRAFT_1399493 [Trametopsis cervina]
MNTPQQLPASDLRSTTLTPYLQLSHLLSLTWLAYPILSLLFVAFRLQLSSASAQTAVDSAKDDLLTSCLAAEQAATAAASMPRYMAAATNAQIADAVNGTMRGARATLVLALTIMEAIINFIVDTYRSTFLCFLELVVRGGLSILISAVQELNNAVGAAANGIRSAIQGSIDAANTVIDKALSIIPGAPSPKIPVPDLSSLQNVTLPPDFENALVKLNNSLPTLSDLKSKIDDIIDTPFELVKKDINDTFAGLTFDANTLPVPQQNSVAFCGQMDTSVVDDLGRDLIKIAKIGVLIIAALALLLLAAHCLLEWYKWRCLTDHLRYTREAWISDPAIYHPGGKTNGAPNMQLTDHNLLMLSGNMMHPLLTKIANRISGLLRLSPSKHIHLSWFFHYVFHPPALACFLIGFFGLLSVQIQIIAIGPLEHRYQQQAVASSNDFSNLIATSINASMYNQSAAYANDVNGRVDHVQSVVNDGLFGWVNGTTTVLNNTINAFYTDLQDAVQTVFNGTILESPVEEFIRCFIGSKVDAIEKALTFLHDNLNIDIPRVNDTVLVLSPASVDEATQPIAAAAIGSGDGSNQGIVGKLVNAYVESLKKERIMFAVFLGLWLFVVLMALSIIWWHSYGRDMLERYKKRRWEKKQRTGINGILVPFRDFGNGQEKGSRDFESFTPEPARRPGLFSNLRSGTLSGKNNNITVHPYPASNGQPFDKSWDSFLDHASPNEPVPSPPDSRNANIGSPRRLMALGRSGTKDSDATTETIVDESELPWLTRFTTKFWKKDVKTEEATDEKASIQERVRPKLTITTSNGSVKSIDDEKVENTVPVSAWSVSPRKSTWISNLASTKLATLRPKSRRTVSVPKDVDLAETDDTFVEPERHAPFALPIHHGFPNADTPLSPPPPPPSFQFPAYAAPMPTYSNRHLAPPQHPSVKKNAVPPPPGLARPATHTRHDSSTNPFATPFDDRYGVGYESPTSERKSISTNPFVGVAF